MHRHRNVRLVGALLGSWLLLGAAGAGWSQEPGSLDASGGVPQHKPVNLKVLPQDITVPTLGKLMKGFEADLGVKCAKCHVQDPATGKLDYASDQNPAKDKARIMITMLKDINDKYLAQLGGDRRYAAKITCGSCHQGNSSPPEFDAK